MGNKDIVCVYTCVHVCECVYLHELANISVYGCAHMCKYIIVYVYA